MASTQSEALAATKGKRDATRCSDDRFLLSNGETRRNLILAVIGCEASRCGCAAVPNPQESRGHSDGFAHDPTPKEKAVRSHARSSIRRSASRRRAEYKSVARNPHVNFDPTADVVNQEVANKWRSGHPAPPLWVSVRRHGIDFQRCQTLTPHAAPRSLTTTCPRQRGLQVL